ncbi:22150_t:CDS:2 [Dentiscutata erythropus]|uniref:22150_t:CDS:1 n=1 Tax=Dentiscutata erythropus TaxID=1348616 RepID=A0A9N9GAD9_9GLOM|nr:22150_t:CDS:2 [Dentiscutata erythropus]
MQDVNAETLIFVCYNLRPSDLLAMVCVCKYFKGVLDENVNPLAAEIWKNSRIKFTIFREMEPPSSMNQKTFTRLLTFEKGCQFCKNKEKPLAIYWIPGVRSCKDCMVPRIISSHILGSTFKIDDEVLELIVPVTQCMDLSRSIRNMDLPRSIRKHTHYWNDHVKNVIAYLMNADDNMRRELNDLKKEVEKKREEAQNYENWMINLRQSYLREQEEIFFRLHVGLNKEILTMMKEDYEYKKFKTEVENNPYLDWQQYTSRIDPIVRRIEIIQKRILIVKRLKKFTYASKRRSQYEFLSIRDKLYIYLPICPSFISPPDLKTHDPEFFERVILPTLIREAAQLDLAGTAPPPYFLEIDGALTVGNFRNHKIFECRLCEKSRRFNIKKFKTHIRSVHDLDDSLDNLLLTAEVNCDAALKKLFYAFF